MKKLTKRETVLLTLLVLVLVGFGYFKLVHEPVQQGIQNAADRQSTAETQLLVEAGKLRQMQTMEAELETLEGEAGYELPDYDNLQHIMIQLNAILGTSQDYSLTFGELQFGDSGLVTRPIQMSFSAEGYEIAREIINNLYSSQFRCRIGNISVSSGEGDIAGESVKVSLTATFYELVRD